MTKLLHLFVAENLNWFFSVFVLVSQSIVFSTIHCIVRAGIVRARMLRLIIFSFQSHFLVVKVLESLLSVKRKKEEQPVRDREKQKITTMKNERSSIAQMLLASVVVHPILSFWVSLFHFFHIVHMKRCFFPTFMLILLFILLVPLCLYPLSTALVRFAFVFIFIEWDLCACVRACAHAVQ